jgi:hypothetical protein
VHERMIVRENDEARHIADNLLDVCFRLERYKIPFSLITIALPRIHPVG